MCVQNSSRSKNWVQKLFASAMPQSLAFSFILTRSAYCPATPLSSAHLSSCCLFVFMPPNLSPLPVTHLLVLPSFIFLMLSNSISQCSHVFTSLTLHLPFIPLVASYPHVTPSFSSSLLLLPALPQSTQLSSHCLINLLLIIC